MDTPTPELIIVSGQPRSGTSLMMRLLDESGVPVFAGEKVSYEAKATNILQTNNEWILHLDPGTALKVLWPQILHLPIGPTYKIIWMHRNPRECAKSQAKFLGRNRNWKKLKQVEIKKVEAKAPKIINSVDSVSMLRISFEAVLRGMVKPVEKFLGREITISPIINRNPRAGIIPAGALEIAAVNAAGVSGRG